MTARTSTFEASLVPDWPDAECQFSDPELFFPDVTPAPGALHDAWKQAATAMIVCGGCPREQQCLDRAHLIRVEEGVWGGVWFHAGKPMRRRGRAA